jgi:hypothetical protein
MKKKTIDVMILENTFIVKYRTKEMRIQQIAAERIVSRRKRTRIDRVLCRRLIVIKRDCTKKASINPIM